MAKTFQSRATLTGISSKVDGGLSLRFVTKELTPDEKLTALEFQNQYGWVLFRENEFTPEDVPTEDAEDPDRKSLAQQLRNVFYVYWLQKHITHTDFDTFYSREMKKIIETVKDKLEKRGE
jgi:hypothetical protein